MFDVRRSTLPTQQAPAPAPAPNLTTDDDDDDDALLDATIDDDVPWFNLDGMLLRCKVVEVYDGDTITLIFPLEGKAWRENADSRASTHRKYAPKTRLKKRPRFGRETGFAERHLDESCGCGVVDGTSSAACSAHFTGNATTRRRNNGGRA